MYQECPEPKIGDEVTLTYEVDGVLVDHTYRALTADGYNTRWKKIASIEIIRLSEDPDNPNDYVYMSDGLYIHANDAWW